jgi:hypothetical protein
LLSAGFCQNDSVSNDVTLIIKLRPYKNSELHGLRLVLVLVACCIITALSGHSSLNGALNNQTQSSMMCTDEDDNNGGYHAIVMKRSVDDDVLSVRSMPLQKDDDYFYYHGEGEDDGDDDDSATIDHIGLLISHPPLSSIKQPLISDLSLDASIPDDDNDEDPQLDDDINAFYSTQECAHLKDEIADLKAQLDDQKKQFEERNMSLEAENVGLKVMLKDTQEIAQNNLADARRVERLLQG